MADAAKTKSALITSYADNTAGAIVAQTHRDMVESFAARPASYYVSSASATTISVAGTYYKAAGTTTQVESHADWTHASNKLTYDGTPSALVEVTATICATCASSTQVLGFRVVKNGTPAGTEAVASTVRRKIGTGSDVGACSIQAFFSMSTNDYVEVYTTNETSTGAVTIDNMSVHVKVYCE